MAKSSVGHPSTDIRPARRAALKATIAAATVAVLGSARTTPASAKQISQELAAYQSSPNKGDQCSGCQYFVEPHSCKIVAGTISPNGWCQFWLKKSA